MYHAYFTADEAGEEIPINELAKRAGFNNGGEIQGHLKRIGLRPLCWEKHPLTQEQEQMVNRASYTDFSAEDICYFGEIRTSFTSVAQKLGGRKRQDPIFTSLKKAGLTYRLASQIYYALDNNYSQRKICEILPTLTGERIERALDMRSEVEPRIIMNLRKMTGDKSINKSYLLPVLGGHN